MKNININDDKTRKMILIAVAAAAVVVVSVIAALSSRPYSAYTKALKKLNNAKQMQLDLSMTLTMTLGEQDIPMTTYVNVKRVETDNSDLQFEMDMSMEFLDDERSIKSYYKDGFYYYKDYLGQTNKMKMDQAEAIRQMYVTGFDITKESVLDVSQNKIDGGRELVFLISPDISNEVMERQYRSLMENHGVDREDIIVSDITLTAAMDSRGMLRKTNVDFTADIVIDNNTIPFTYNIATSVVSAKDVVIEFPDDLESYESGE